MGSLEPKKCTLRLLPIIRLFCCWTCVAGEKTIPSSQRRPCFPISACMELALVNTNPPISIMRTTFEQRHQACLSWATETPTSHLDKPCVRQASSQFGLTSCYTEHPSRVTPETISCLFVLQKAFALLSA